MKTVALVYGWAEGPWQGKKFVHELEEQGFAVIDDAARADIVIGHSLGCYLIPKQASAKLVILIGLPFWPERNYLHSVAAKLINEVSYHRKNEGLGWWANKILLNTWYILTRPSLSYYGLSRTSPKYLPSSKQFKVVLVRPAKDTFCHPRITILLPRASDYKFHELPGAHDDCWFKPKAYIELIRGEL